MTEPSRLAGAAAAGVAAFFLVALAVQFLRPDLDWYTTPLSFYLFGPYGPLLQAAYVALALGTLALGLGWYRALSPAATSFAPTLLFIVAAVGIVVTALARTDTWAGPPTLEGFVHGNAARTAFLAITTAMLLQSWRLRHDLNWRRYFSPAFALAAICFVALWVHTLWRGSPRGLGQKLVIVLIVAWLALAALWLKRSRRGP